MKKILFTAALALILFACNDYGTKLEFDGTEVYYTENITETQAQALGKFLEESGFTDGTGKTVQLDKRDDTYLFRMVKKEDVELTDELKSTMSLFAVLISQSAFDGNAVDIELCNDRLETQHVIPWESGDTENNGSGESEDNPA
jgi:hypothetical protein